MASVEILHNGVLEGNKDAIYALVSGADPNILFSAGGDGMIIRWDLAHKGDGELVARLPAAIYGLQYFADANMMLAGTRFGGLYALDLKTHKQKALIDLKHDIFKLCLLPEQNLVAAACANGYLYFVQAETLDIVHLIQPGQASCRTLALSPDGGYLASGWSDGMIRVYDTNSFAEIQSFTAHTPSVFALVYNRVGDKLISGGRDAQIRVWDTAISYIETKKIPAHLFTVNDLVMIPEYGLMASASRDKTVKIWDSENFDLLKVIDRAKLPAHSHSVNKLLWTGYENNLVSAGDDKVIRIWGIICG
jgi:WD40 repeat protein